MIGKSISHYRIVDKIGQGGMGEVYKAEDTTLDRKVALKFLPEAFTSDPERMARFEREAKLLASLNHPNIAGIYGLEQADGNRFLVLEYVEGETLQARLSKGALPLEDALALCCQIAEGLEAAHEKGVIHRDLKPANVMITADEKVKILDFGLAKALSDEIQSIDSSQSPTLTEAMTRPGVILGTAAYMSPEQARGKSADKRADIWSFAVILYEMLTGSQLFKGETVSDTIASVLTWEPDFDKVPIKVRPLLKRCLTKDPKLRLRDIGDAMSLLEFTPEIESPIQPTKSNRLAWGVAILAVLIASVSFIFYFLGKSESESELWHFRVDYPEKVLPGFETAFYLSPDGRKLAFIGTSSDNKNNIWIHSFESSEVKILPGVELESNVSTMIWSPDSLFIAFYSDGKLKKVNVDNGIVETLCELSGFIIGGTWSQNGVILFGDHSGSRAIMSVPATGDTPMLVASPKQENEEIEYAFPQFLPDGERFLYFCNSATPESTGIYVGYLNSKPEEQNPRQVLKTNTNAVFVPSTDPDKGYLLTTKNNNIIARTFNTESFEQYGNPTAIVQRVGKYWAYGFFSVSNSGVLAYRRAFQKQFVWIARNGEVQNTLDEPGEYTTFDLSKNKDKLVVSKVVSEGEQNLLIIDTIQGHSTPLTTDNVEDVDPRWTSDSQSVIFGSARDASRSPYRISPTASNTDPEQVFKHTGGIFALDDVSPDDKYLLYHNSAGSELWYRSLDGDNDPTLITRRRKGGIDQAQFSPDGLWIAFNTDESGRNEVIVVPFPPSGTGEEWHISNEGGMQPTWNKDGSELYFLTSSGTLMVVDILPGEDFQFDKNIRSLFESEIYPNYDVEDYAPSPDGKSFLFLKPVREDMTKTFDVILNWTKSLDQ